MTSKLRVLSVFVCSCYRDMQAERASLHEIVFPEIRPLFQERGFDLRLVDPRWIARSEEQAEGSVTLSQSLAFIDRCRPCFLGLLGSNYGTVYPRVPADINHFYPEIQYYARCSRIHLEMLYGVLQSPLKAEQSYFYFRKPDFLDRLSDAERAPFFPTNPVEIQRQKEEYRLKLLKDAIKSHGRPVHSYQCEWDAAKKCVTGLEQFRALIQTDLMNLLDSVAPRLVVKVPAALAAPEPAQAETISVPEEATIPMPEAAALSAGEPVLFEETVALAAPVEAAIALSDQTMFGGAAALPAADLPAPRADLEAPPAEGAPVAAVDGAETAPPAAAMAPPVPGSMDEPASADANAGLAEAGAIFSFTEAEAGPVDSEPAADTPAFVDHSVQDSNPPPMEPALESSPLRLFREDDAEEQGAEAETHAETESAEPIEHDRGDVSQSEEIPAAAAPPQAWDNEPAPTDESGVVAGCTEALQLNPDDIAAYRRRAAAYLRHGDYSNALADYEEIVRLEPQDPQAYNDRAWIWATCPDARFRDGARAVESASRAVDLEGGIGALMWDPDAGKVFFRVTFKETLAAAHAEAGNFDQALATLDEALAFADKADQPRLLEFRKRYEGREPMRDQPGASDSAPAASPIEEPAPPPLPDLEPGFLDQVFAGPDGDRLRAEHRDWLGRIAINPDDKEVLLQYADWLGNLGDPLGEFIRIDLELESLPEGDERRAALDPRWTELLETHGREWLRPVERVGLEPQLFGRFAPTLWLHHGILDTVTIDRAGILPEQAEYLFDAVPALRALAFKDCSVDVPALARLPQLSQVVSLGLSGLSLLAQDMQALADSPYLAQLTDLDLSFNDIGAEGARALAESPNLRRLAQLDLRGCKIGADGADALANSPLLATVTKLGLDDNLIGTDGMRALAGSPYLGMLDQLSVEGNHEAPIGAEGAAALAESPHLGRLVALALPWNALGDDGIAALTAAPQSCLSSLDLTGNDISTAGAATLANSPLVAALNVLDLTSNEAIGPEGALHLAVSANLGNLRELKLSRCGLGDAGLIGLAASGGMPNLLHLQLAGNRIGPEGARSLANSASLANLSDLDLRENDLGTEGIQALLESPYLGMVQHLWLNDTNFAAEQEEPLKQRFGERVHLY